MILQMVYSSIMPIPEIVTKRNMLRKELGYLGDRTRAWEKFVEVVRSRNVLKHDAFVKDFSCLRWNLIRENLGQSLHLIRLDREYSMRLRVPLPLKASRSIRQTINGTIYPTYSDIRIFPSLFAEFRQRILVADPTVYGQDERQLVIAHIRQSKRVRRDLSHALFGSGNVIASEFSMPFHIRVTRNRGRVSKQVSGGKYPTFIAMNDGKVTISGNSKGGSLLLSRVLEAVVLALAQRVTVPNLWNRIRDLDTVPSYVLTEIFETLFIALAPEYNIHSRRDTPHILNHRYQRKAFEMVAKSLGLQEMFGSITKEFVEVIQGFPVFKLTPLLQVSEPLASKTRSTIRRFSSSRPDHELQPPVRTVVEFLTREFLKDKMSYEYGWGESHRPMDRWGLRTANQVLKGVRALEDEKGISPRIKQEEIYHRSNSILHHLHGLGIVRTAETKRTSASIVYGINPDDPTVEKMMLSISMTT